MCSNFSIDHILNKAGQNDPVKKCENNPVPQNNTVLRYNQYDVEIENTLHQYTFQWLNCTRYHPPKLPRHNRKEGIKRQPGKHPRIPFTAHQIEVLEKSYKNSQYLCPQEIERLTKQLNLSDTRIKIWFQNRRAREKREKEINCQQNEVINVTD